MNERNTSRLGRPECAQEKIGGCWTCGSHAGAKTSAIEYLNEKNGRLKLDVPSVVGEHKVEMRGTVPESWGLV